MWRHCNQKQHGSNAAARKETAQTEKAVLGDWVYKQVQDEISAVFLQTAKN